MLRSEITHVSGPSKSSRRTPSSSPDSSDQENHDNDDERSPRRRNDEREEGEISSKTNSSVTPKPNAVPAKTGGLYMPPAKLRLLQASLTNKSSPEYQRLAWEALKKTINGRVNKVNTSNLPLIIRELFKDNIVRGRGLLARGIIQAQVASPFYTSVYAALVAVINTKFPQIGELVVKRLISSFRRTYQRNDKSNCLATTRFIAHLINQNVLHEIVGLQMLVLLLENPSDDSVELAIGFIKECGQKLSQVSPRGLDQVFATLRDLLHESSLDKRTQYMIEVLFAVRKDQFKANPAIPTGLDLVDENDQYTHMFGLDDPCEPEPMLDVFKFDENYEENEEKYKEIRKTILDEESDDDDDSSSGSSDTDEESGGKDEDMDDDEKPVTETKEQTIIDQTETNLVALRRTIYLTIQSSVGAEECAHKLLKMNLRPGQEMELCQMILDSCAQQRTYERFFGLLGQRFCLLKKEYVECFEKVFQDQYEIVHRLENVKLRNVAKFFAHLLVTDSISWGVLRCIRLTEEDTTSSSRVYIKNLFLELVEFLGLTKLNNRLTDPTLTEYFEGLFPRDNPKNTRFSINFFTSIGLGGLTDELREFLRLNPVQPAAPAPIAPPIKNEAIDHEDRKDHERIQARLREVQKSDERKAKSLKIKSAEKKKKKRSSSSSSSSSSGSSSSSSSSSSTSSGSSSSSPSPPPPPARQEKKKRDRDEQPSKNDDRRKRDQRSPSPAARRNGTDRREKEDDRHRRPDQRERNRDPPERSKSQMEDRDRERDRNRDRKERTKSPQEDRDRNRNRNRKERSPSPQEDRQRDRNRDRKERSTSPSEDRDRDRRRRADDEKDRHHSKKSSKR